MKRRTFLCGSAAFAMSSTIFSHLLAKPINRLALLETPYLETIGLQLWTVRNELEMDKESTLKAVAEAGYKQVELMNTMDSDEIVKIANDLGLKVTSAFMNWESIANPNDGVPTVDAIVEKAEKMGLKHLVFGYIGKGHRETLDHFKRYADAASIAGEKCKEAGIQLCYHNHSFEFKPLEDNTPGFEIFIERFHRDFVMFELDVFWAQIGGWDPVTTLKRLDQRVSQVHLKDLKKGTANQFDEGKVPEDAFQPLGAGMINMAAILATCVEVGVQQCHVEQDQSPSPIESIGTSKKFLDQVKPKAAEKKPAEQAVPNHDHIHDNPFGIIREFGR